MVKIIQYLQNVLNIAILQMSSRDSACRLSRKPYRYLVVCAFDLAVVTTAGVPYPLRHQLDNSYGFLVELLVLRHFHLRVGDGTVNLNDESHQYGIGPVLRHVRPLEVLSDESEQRIRPAGKFRIAEVVDD